MMSKEKLKLALAKLRIVHSAWCIEEAENNDVMLALSEFMELRPSVRNLAQARSAEAERDALKAQLEAAEARAVAAREREAIERLANRIAVENDIHVDRARRGISSLIEKGLIALQPKETPAS